jgi:MFS transporter, FHS family, L-fucose permease
MQNSHSYRAPLIILTSLFFIWGFITCLNDILIPHLKAVFTLNYAQAMLVQFCFFTAYFLVSLPSGALVKRIGYRRGIVYGLGIAACGCFLFYPAAALASYGCFLGALFILASGITLLQVAANPYVTVLGPPQTASSRLTLTQAFNSLGTTLAPFFGTLLILQHGVLDTAALQTLTPDALAAYHAEQAASVQLPYLGLGLLLLGMAVLFSHLRLPELSAEQSPAQADGAAYASIWQAPLLRLGVAAIFLYVGAEVAIGSMLVSFLGLQEIAGLAEQQAGHYVAFYWGGAMLGRFIGAWFMRRIAAGAVLAFNALSAVALLTLAIGGSGNTAMWAVLAIGLCNSIMFPTIFSLALTGLGPLTSQGSGALCAAIVGGALLPLAQGLLADHIGLQPAYALPALCYGYIAYFGWRSTRIA